MVAVEGEPESTCSDKVPNAAAVSDNVIVCTPDEMPVTFTVVLGKVAWVVNGNS
jgi:hypothetical protein